MTAKTVLVVDGDTDSRIIYASILQHHGYDFLEADSGVDALRLVRERRPDMILLDVSLPGGNGFEIVASLRHDQAMAEVPLVALTTYMMPGDRERARSAGFNAYLSKPCSPRRVVEEVERFIGPARALVG